MPDIPHPKEIFTSKRDSIARFIHVIKPLAEVFELPLTSLHIFYDTSGGVIAFNRNASLFLNLRFFEAWRTYAVPPPALCMLISRLVDDDDVRNGDLSKAYTSWSVSIMDTLNDILNSITQVFHIGPRDRP